MYTCDTPCGNVYVAGVLQVCAWLQEGKDVRLGDWTAREIEILNSWQLLTAKPVVYLVNMSAKVGAAQSLGLSCVWGLIFESRSLNLSRKANNVSAAHPSFLDVPLTRCWPVLEPNPET
jgi:hypothetical protein